MSGPSFQDLADRIATIEGLRVELVEIKRTRDRLVARVDVWRLDTGALILRSVLGASGAAVATVKQWADDIARRVDEGWPLPAHADVMPWHLPRRPTPRACTDCDRPADADLGLCRRCEGAIVRAERRLAWGAE